MNREYKLTLDLQFRCNNPTMSFYELDNETSDFFIRITSGGKLVEIDKAIVVLVAIKPSGSVSSQFVEVENGIIYADLKSNMKDEIGKYTAQAMLVLEDERIITDTIAYEVNESNIVNALVEDAEEQEEYSLLTEMLSKLSTIEIEEQQRIINEADRILEEENRRLEERSRIEAELIRQHEEADRTKYEAIRESNEDIRKQNEEFRIENEDIRIQNELARKQEESIRVENENDRILNYSFMTSDEERRRAEADAHAQAEQLRVEAEQLRVEAENNRRIVEQARELAEDARNEEEALRQANEEIRQDNEELRQANETLRQENYNALVADINYTSIKFDEYIEDAEANEETRVANEATRQSNESIRQSNEITRISNENTRKANEVLRQSNETSRENVFTNHVYVINNMIDDLNEKQDELTDAVDEKIDEIETRFATLTAEQQQDAEVIDARDGEESLATRLNRDIENAQQIFVDIEGSVINTDSSEGYLKDIELLGNTVQNAEDLADIRSVGTKVEGQELYEIPVVSRGKNLFDGYLEKGSIEGSSGQNIVNENCIRSVNYIRVFSGRGYISNLPLIASEYDAHKKHIQTLSWNNGVYNPSSNCSFVRFRRPNGNTDLNEKIQLEEGTQATPYEPYVEDKLTILSPTQLEKVGDVADRIICKDGVWGVEKNIKTYIVSLDDVITRHASHEVDPSYRLDNVLDTVNQIVISDRMVSTEFTSLYNGKDYGCSTHPSNKHLYMRVEGISSLSDIKNYILGMELKFSLTQPQFIPLPHDQQIKLRTFAGQTNIHFETEIEPTIKAQVPKSIGASINTHTEQIGNLSKELDRVKKLEESTVSTVETESAFTTVEETSNGYFEDVKLEGKTLNNLWDIDVIDLSINTVTMPKYAHTLKSNTKYTFIFNATVADYDTVCLYAHTTSDNSLVYYNIAPDTSGINIKTFTPSEDATIFYIGRSTTIEGLVYSNCILLEGDHTQNPPSYFEGLKSSGQDELVLYTTNAPIRFGKGGRL